jgi:hypothetical protein
VCTGLTPSSGLVADHCVSSGTHWAVAGFCSFEERAVPLGQSFFGPLIGAMVTTATISFTETRPRSVRDVECGRYRRGAAVAGWSADTRNGIVDEGLWR